MDTRTRDLLRLTLAPGVGPVLIARLIAAFGSPEAVTRASPAELRRVKGIGEARASALSSALAEPSPLVERELALVESRGARLIAIGTDAYPPLLAQIPDPPPILYVMGELAPRADQYPLAIVGARECTAYGVEQAERFASVLARSGITIVSGGARGIDTAAHRGALRGPGRTIAVLGCGLGALYPPENVPLFASIARGQGAIVSELPMATPPNAENFPARNRIISGLSLGVFVVEAGRKSGSLITAQHAEEHGREVMALPGRVDSPASAGSIDLIKQGAAACVSDPGDVLGLLETPARHQFEGSHESRYTDPGVDPAQRVVELDRVAESGATPGAAGVILSALSSAMSLEDLSRRTGLAPAVVRAELTMLEIQRRVKRDGNLIAKRDTAG